MKKFYIAAALVAALFLSSSALTAADGKDSQKADEDRYPSFKGFVTNKFWDNWEISLNFGTGFSAYSSGNYGAYGDRFGVNGEFSVAKWLHPVVGVRAGFWGGNYNTVHPDYGKIKWPFLFGHVDAMLNLSNWIGGYKEDRVYYAVIYAGMGLFGSNFTDASQAAVHHASIPTNFAFTGGLINKFRVSPSIDINLELRGLLGMAYLNPVNTTTRGNYLGTGNVSVGVTYRFGKRDFERGAAGYTMADIECLKREAEEAAATAQATEDDMNTRLAQAEEAQAAAEQRAAQAEKELAEALAQIEELNDRISAEDTASTDTVFFGYGLAVLSSADQIRLQVLAEQFKSEPESAEHSITGYADFSTGERAKNIALAQKRARVVYDYLVSLGVPASRLSYRGAGEDEQPFTSDGNQTVIIK
ncbi:MAG TPA: OmpA family protein [Candidatus Coprenecus pullistercoris]|nr:OmpA family protein [Candidatus Coprenecus pullistercoris]